jgi:hypothetical protein
MSAITLPRRSFESTTLEANRAAEFLRNAEDSEEENISANNLR